MPPYAYLCTSSTSLGIIDTQTNTLLTTLSGLGVSTYYARVSPDGTKIAMVFAGSGATNVQFATITGWSGTAPTYTLSSTFTPTGLGGNGGDCCWALDSSKVYISNQNGYINSLTPAGVSGTALNVGSAGG